MKSKKDSEEYKKYQKYLKSKEFKALRDRVLERDGYRCRFCGRTLEEISENKKISLQAHHSSYEHLGECNDLEYNDLVTLCSVCHNACHKAKSNLGRFKNKNINK